MHTQTGIGTTRWPAEGWLSGNACDLANCIDQISVSESLLMRGTVIPGRSVQQAAGLFQHRLEPAGDDPIAELLHQEAGEQTDRMAMAILANAVIFHNVIAPQHRLRKLRELTGAIGQIAPGLATHPRQDQRLAHLRHRSPNPSHDRCCASQSHTGRTVGGCGQALRNRCNYSARHVRAHVPDADC